VTPSAGSPPIDWESVSRLVDQLDQDLNRLEAGKSDDQETAHLKAEIAELRRLLAGGPSAEQQLSAGLLGLRRRLHAFSDELFVDAVRSGDYVARLGRLLGL
jgi:hypothetical protein